VDTGVAGERPLQPGEAVDNRGGGHLSQGGSRIVAE
jgi:hypothetical protein